MRHMIINVTVTHNAIGGLAMIRRMSVRDIITRKRVAGSHATVKELSKDHDKLKRKRGKMAKVSRRKNRGK